MWMARGLRAGRRPPNLILALTLLADFDREVERRIAGSLDQGWVAGAARDPSFVTGVEGVTFQLDDSAVVRVRSPTDCSTTLS
jgi:hypothetical protein